jgi:precorrin-4/cobalt-precorrin-4 C11-methyltransferase
MIPPVKRRSVTSLKKKNFHLSNTKSAATVVMALMLFLSTAACFAKSRAPERSADNIAPGLYLVSVGNGDRDNITLRALKTIQAADIIFCGGYTEKEFSNLLRGKEIQRTTLNVHRTFMRKKTADYPKALEEVKRVSGIVRGAIAQGKTVAVLDSGDVTIYGPNMWFMEVFEDLNPEIVPGVSSFNCANAALKKSVAAGENTRSIALSNGMDIERLAKAKTSMVFFTMHLPLEEIVSRLKPHYGGDMPIAIVGNAGYRDKERIYRGTLDTILDKTRGEKLPVHLVYVGDFLTRRYGIKEAEADGAGETTDMAGQATRTGKAKKKSDRPLVLSEWNMPVPTILGDPKLHERLESIHVTTKNCYGMVREINLIQCHQFHTRPDPEGLLATAMEKKERGEKAAALNSEGGGMCLGMVAGYLASHYAIRAIYGADIDDFTLGSNCPMAGLWDSLNLVCAKDLVRGDPAGAPSRGSFSFTITRASDGRTRTFTFSKAYREKFERFFDMKWNPEKYGDAENKIRKLQEEIIQSLLIRFAGGDYGYFELS